MAYKATVMVTLPGAMDNWDALIPTDTDSYNSYSNFRNVLLGQYASAGFPRDLPTLAATALTPLNAGPDALQPGRTWSMSPQLPDFAALFNQGNAAIVADVGPLLKKGTTGVDIESGVAGVDFPKRLRSHNDQQDLIAKGGDDSFTSGVLGRMSEALTAKFSLPAGHESYERIQPGFSSQYLKTSNRSGFDVGQGGSPAGLTTWEPIFFAGGHVSSSDPLSFRWTHPMMAMLNGVGFQPIQGPPITEDYYAPRGLLEASFDGARRSNYQLGQVYRAWMDEAIPSPNGAYVPNAATGRDDYDRPHRAIMNIIARSASTTPIAGGIQHQFFHARLGGGYDTHANQAATLPALQTALNAFVKALWDDIVLLGLQNDVLIIVQGEFGRTLSVNDTGTDHGWGNYHFFFGGGMQGGGKIIGGTPIPPIYNPATQYDPAYPFMSSSRGHIVPRNSIEQCFANIGIHHGLTPAEIDAGVGASPAPLPGLSIFQTSTIDDAVLPVV